MIFSRDGALATVRLNRPEDHNRITPQDLDELAAHLGSVDADREIRALVLASSGKTFSAGFHIGEIATGAHQRFESTADALAHCRVPTIAALQGNVYGGAADLALACDFRIGVETMELMVPPARLGIPYYSSGIERFVTRLAPGAARRILLAAETFHARELAAIGFLDEVTTHEQLESRVAALAAKLAAHAPLAMEAMKRILNSVECGQLDRASAARAIENCLVSDDHREALAAWNEKRAPLFRGK
jgi:enoyl-CoA hydratase